MVIFHSNLSVYQRASFCFDSESFLSPYGFGHLAPRRASFRKRTGPAAKKHTAAWSPAEPRLRQLQTVLIFDMGTKSFQNTNSNSFLLRLPLSSSHSKCTHAYIYMYYIYNIYIYNVYIYIHTYLLNRILLASCWIVTFAMEIQMAHGTLNPASTSGSMAAEWL